MKKLKFLVLLIFVSCGGSDSGGGPSKENNQNRLENADVDKPNITCNLSLNDFNTITTRSINVNLSELTKISLSDLKDEESTKSLKLQNYYTHSCIRERVNQNMISGMESEHIIIPNDLNIDNTDFNAGDFSLRKKLLIFINDTKFGDQNIDSSEEEETLFYRPLFIPINDSNITMISLTLNYLIEGFNSDESYNLFMTNNVLEVTEDRGNNLSELNKFHKEYIQDSELFESKKEVYSDNNGTIYIIESDRVDNPKSENQTKILGNVILKYKLVENN